MKEPCWHVQIFDRNSDRIFVFRRIPRFWVLYCPARFADAHWVLVLPVGGIDRLVTYCTLVLHVSVSYRGHHPGVGEEFARNARSPLARFGFFLHVSFRESFALFCTAHAPVGMAGFPTNSEYQSEKL